MPSLQAVRAPETDVLAMLPPSETRVYDKGEVIYERQPERVYHLLSGLVRVYREHATGVVNLGLFLPGSTFALSALYGYSSVGTAKALEDSRVMAWTPKAVEDAIFDVPGLANTLNRAAIAESLILQDRVAEMASHKIRPRLAGAIMRHVEALGERSQGSVLLRRFPHHYWAAEIGTSRELVTAVLGEFATLGAITMSRGHHIPMRVYPEKLAKIAVGVMHA